METPVSKTLQELYARIPDVGCKGLCVDACGPIGMTRAEWEMIQAAHPGVRLAIGPDWKCSLLKEGRCSIYNERPYVCRMYGAVEAMRCPHGCEPVRMVPDHAADTLMRHLQRLNPSGEQVFSEVVDEAKR